MEEIETLEIGDLPIIKKGTHEKSFTQEYFPHLIGIVIFIILLAIGSVIYYELYMPGEFCKSVEKEHNIVLTYPPLHFCGYSLIRCSIASSGEAGSPGFDKLKILSPFASRANTLSLPESSSILKCFPKVL